MTAASALPAPPWLTAGKRLLIGTSAAVIWAIGRAGLGDEIINRGGWPSFSEFWLAVGQPVLAADFLRLTADAALTTLALAALGTALSVVIGALAALALSTVFTERRRPWLVSRLALAGPRSVHEILWALLLLQVFGFDPLVAVLAIGLPFGAVTAKVFAETIDEADPAGFRHLRASGASRMAALAYGLLPQVRGQLLSYVFYRFECAIRSAAVLGIVGVGGLGYQLDLSFESLRYGEIWTLIAALMLLSGLGDAWSTLVRRSTSAHLGRSSLVVAVVLIPLAWWWAGLDASIIWSGRSRRLAAELATDVFPPRLGLGGWSELIDAAIDTVAMSIIAIAIAVAGGLVIGVMAATPKGRAVHQTGAGVVGRSLLRLGLLLLRAVPAPIWAFVMVLVLFPGLWPGAVALGLYNLGVLGRLFAETIESRDIGPTDALAVSGAGSLGRLFYGILPTAAPKLAALSLYRWEVITRETVVVGVVGAGGLGQLINEHLAARDFAAVAGAAATLVGISVAIDLTSSRVRSLLR